MGVEEGEVEEEEEVRLRSLPQEVSGGGTTTRTKKIATYKDEHRT